MIHNTAIVDPKAEIAEDVHIGPYTVIEGKVEIRPMMYLALSYDHRLIDGSEAVSFLVRVKECIENPERMLLEI